VYCWFFGVLACCAVGALASTIRELARKDTIDKGNIANIAVLSFYAVIFFIAWWTSFRHRRSSKVWGIAASCLMAAPFLPFLAVGAWQVFWHEQHSWLLFMPFGILGIIAFSVPHHRDKLHPQKDETLIDEPAVHQRSAAHLAVDIGRRIYGWAFFANACFSVYWLGMEGLRAIVKHSGILSDLAVGVPYAAVFCVAWWMIFRGSTASNQWAIAANCLVVVPHLAFVPLGNWGAVWWLRNYEPFPYTPFAILGILLFSLPYFRSREQMQAVVS